MSPRPQRPFERIPFRQNGYGTKAATVILSERGYSISTWMLRAAADRGQIAVQRSPGGHRRFMADELERFLRTKI